MNNLLSYYGLVDARINASEIDLPVIFELKLIFKLKLIFPFLLSFFMNSGFLKTLLVTKTAFE